MKKMSLVLNEEAIKELNSFLQEMPLKFGLPLLNFINSKIVEQNKEVELPNPE